MLTQERLKDLLCYSKETGEFARKTRPNNRVKMGDVAGTIDKKGYIVIKIDSKSYKAARLAFLYVNGCFPEKQADHINRIKTDNRWCNLREVSNAENCRNKSNNNSVIGVLKEKNWKWRAYTSKEGKTSERSLGGFDYYLQACAARWEYEALSWQ